MDRSGCITSAAARSRGDIMAPVVPYEDYTFDENNVCPEAYALRIAAIKPRKRKSK